MSALLTHYEDTVSVDDVIDLNQDCSSSSDGRSTSQHHYRISLHSIDDDELRLFRRDLVTPAPSVCGGGDDVVDVGIKRNMIRSRFVPPSRIQRPVSRGESVMLFKKINNGDEDVSFDDLVSSELRDFLDTDFMMDGILSRPVSRTTIDKNASKIQDISKFRSTVSNNNNNEQKHPPTTKNQRTMLPSKLRSLSTSKSNPTTEIQAQEKSRSENHPPPQRMLSSVPESPRLYQNTHRLFHHRAPIAATTTTNVPAPTRDDYLCKQMPKKPFTMIPKQTALPRDKYTPPPTRNAAAAVTSPSPSQTHKFVHGYQTPPSVSVPLSTRRPTKSAEHVSKPIRNYERKLPDPVVEQPPLTPRFTSRKFVVPPPPPPQQRNMTYGNYLGRTRSDTTATTTTTTSSSDEDEPNEEPPLFTTTHNQQHHYRSYSSSTAAGAPPLTFDHYTTHSNHSPLFHRYNKTMEYKSLSSPRLRTMSSHKTFPTPTIISSNHSSGTATTATTTTYSDDAGVIDSAKQVLACIRERRKRAMLSGSS